MYKCEIMQELKAGNVTILKTGLNQHVQPGLLQIVAPLYQNHLPLIELLCDSTVEPSKPVKLPGFKHRKVEMTN